MARHAEDALRGTRVSQVLDLPLTIPTPEAAGTEGLIAREDGQIFDLVAASIAAVGAVVADEGPVAKEEQVRIGIELGAAGLTPETGYVPPVAG